METSLDDASLHDGWAYAQIAQVGVNHLLQTQFYLNSDGMDMCLFGELRLLQTQILISRIVTMHAWYMR
jgi:hypothetical protein